MRAIERILYSGVIPESFFTITSKIYNDLSFIPTEDASTVRSLFEFEAERNEIIIYTNHINCRLVGIFPCTENIAYFGFWETVNDTEICLEAFTLFEMDARYRNRSSIVGPLNFNTFHNYRLRVGPVASWNSFDKEPVNPVYYSTLLYQLGYAEKSIFESRLISKETVPGVY
ncbi:MAG TPA: hypothetical protein VF623_01820, partial [Segetibacter sp.]